MTLTSRRGEVRNSPDLQRILALPRRDVDFTSRPMRFEHLQANVGQPCKCLEWKRACCKELLPLQSWTLYELARNEGALGNIQVGAGKTLIGLLSPFVVPRCKVAVLFVQADLKPQLLEMDWHFYGQHWRLPNLAGGRWFVPGRPVLHVLTYHELQNPKSAALLERLNPDFIAFDEVHNIKDLAGTRTNRVLQYATDKPVRCAGWSGTITTKSLTDYAHISALALKHQSPLPLDSSTVEEWASCVDAGARHTMRLAPGVLRQLCASPHESTREGLRRRLVQTPGVISSTGNVVGTSLVFYERTPTMPEEVKQAIRKAENQDLRPDDHLLEDLSEREKCVRQLACGFYYRWYWPRGEPLEVRTEWLAVRKAWNAELRDVLKNPRQRLDSPSLWEEAARRFYVGGCDGCTRGPLEPHARGCTSPLPLWESTMFPEWERVRDTARPETEAIWLSDYLVEDAVAWAKRKPGIVWSRYESLARRIAEVGGLPLYGAGTEASLEILRESGKRSIVASIRAHGVGKNLQMFSSNLMVSPPSGGGVWEQTLGRTLRQGQLADMVTCTVYRHSREFVEPFNRARESAAYVLETTGAPQKLLFGNYTFPIPHPAGSGH